MVKAKKKVAFKSYTPTQALLLPPDLEELIPRRHLVRVVNAVVDKMDMSSIVETYEGGGPVLIIPGCCSKCCYMPTA